jgi:prepilin signal peptidase PulO-like enzyme (type II secretory pathway)
LGYGGVVPREAFACLFYDAPPMTTIEARPPGSRASTHRFGVACAAAPPLLAAAAVLQGSPVFLALGAVATIVAVAARHDARRAVIPDQFVMSAAAIPCAIALVGALQGARTWVDIVAGAAVMSLPLLVLHTVDPRLFGFGDVKLAAALGAALGLVDPHLGLVALGVAAFASLCHAVETGAHRVPFASALLLGFTAAAVMACIEGAASR